MNRRNADMRAQLEALAQGRTLAARFSNGNVVDVADVERHQADFRAWHQFAAAEGGEPLPAPSEILTPLP